MIRINLLPVRATQKKERLRGQLIVAALSVLLVVAGCGIFYASLLSKVGNEKKAIAAKQGEIKRLKKVLGEVSHFKKLQEELRGKLEVLEKLKEGKTGPVHLLDDLSISMPDKLWLTHFKENKGQISITGVGLNEETVAQFLINLEQSPYYSNVELQVIEQLVQNNVKLQKFNVGSKVESPKKEKQTKEK